MKNDGEINQYFVSPFSTRSVQLMFERFLFSEIMLVVFYVLLVRLQ